MLWSCGESEYMLIQLDKLPKLSIDIKNFHIFFVKNAKKLYSAGWIGLL